MMGRRAVQALNRDITVLISAMLLLLVGVTSLLPQPTWAKHRVDLRERLDATQVMNASPREMEMIAYSQHPGLEQWKHWKIQIQQPDSGDLMSCWNSSMQQCKTFQHYSDYLSFRIHEFYENDRHHFFHHRHHQGRYAAPLSADDSSTEITNAEEAHYH